MAVALAADPFRHAERCRATAVGAHAHPRRVLRGKRPEPLAGTGFRIDHPDSPALAKDQPILELYIVEYAADTSNPMVTAFRGYVPDFTGSVPGDGQRRIQLGAKLEF